MSQNTFFGGIDIGASATKVAVIDGERRLVASDVRKTGVSFEACAQEAMDSAMASCGLNCRTFPGFFDRVRASQCNLRKRDPYGDCLPRAGRASLLS